MKTPVTHLTRQAPLHLQIESGDKLNRNRISMFPAIMYGLLSYFRLFPPNCSQRIPRLH